MEAAAVVRYTIARSREQHALTVVENFRARGTLDGDLSSTYLKWLGSPTSLIALTRFRNGDSAFVDTSITDKNSDLEDLCRRVWLVGQFDLPEAEGDVVGSLRTQLSHGARWVLAVTLPE